MARFFRRGLSQLFYLPAWAVANPTTLEIGAGTELTDSVQGITGFQFQNTPIATPDLGSTFTSTIGGEDTTQNPSITFYDDAASTTIRAALAKGTAGFLAFMPYGDVTTKRVERWPIISTGVNDAWSTGNEAAMFTVSFAITSVPNQNAALP